MASQMDSLDISRLKQIVLTSSDVSDDFIPCLIGYAHKLTQSSLLKSQTLDLISTRRESSRGTNSKTDGRVEAKTRGAGSASRPHDAPPGSPTKSDPNIKPAIPLDLATNTFQPRRLCPSASQPDLSGTIPDSSKSKMTTVYSQSQGDTQPLSQSAYKEFSNSRNLNEDIRETSASNGGAVSTNGGAPFFYSQGQTGHIDILGVFEQPSIMDPENDLEGHDRDDDGLTSQVDVAAEPYPESRRFQQPKTPATGNKKRNHQGEMIQEVNTTPRLPTNPFTGRSAGMEGIMNLSQVFRTTQAPSSPFPDVLPSDGISERPSPAMSKYPAVGTTSSPSKFQTSPIVRTVTEPQAIYISMKESQEQRERLIREKRARSLENDAYGQEPSDDDFDFEDVQLRRRLRKKRIDAEAESELSEVSAPSRPGSRGRVKGPNLPPLGKIRREVSNWKPIGKANLEPSGSKPNDAVVISDDPPMEEAQDNTTEDETDREVEDEGVKEKLLHEPSDENKENLNSVGVQVPMTNVKTVATAARAVSSPASPTRQHSRRPSTTGSQKSIQFDHTEASPQSTISSGKVNAVLRGTPMSAIADSQPSERHVKFVQNQMHMIEQSLSSPDSRIIIPQSQLYQPLNELQHRTNGMPGGPRNFQSSPSLAPPASSNHDQGSSPSNRNDLLSPLKRTRDAESMYGSTHKPKSGRTSLNHSDMTPLQVEAKKHHENSSKELRLPYDDTDKDIDEGLPRTRKVAVESLSLGSGRDADLDRALSKSQENATGSALCSGFAATIARSTIPETSPLVDERDKFTPIVSFSDPGLSNSKPLPPASLQQSNGSTPFETAKTHQDASPKGRNASAPQQSSPQNNISPISRQKRPRTFTEIIAQPSPLGIAEDVDIDIDILSKEDIEIQAAIDGSSPIGPSRKRRRGRGGRILLHLEPKPNELPSAPLQLTQERERSDRQALEVVKETIPHPYSSRPRRSDNPGFGSKGSISSEIGIHSSHVANNKSSARNKHLQVADISKRSIFNTLGKGFNQSDMPGAGQEITSTTLNQTAPTGQIGHEDPTIVAPNRVFAHFNGNYAGYYPATCIGVIGDEEPRYRVRFDDGSTDIINGYNIKSLDLRVGDTVKLNLPGTRSKKYVVEGMQDKQRFTHGLDLETPTRKGLSKYSTASLSSKTDIRGFASVALSPKQPTSNGCAEALDCRIIVPLKDIYFTQTMWTNFKDRGFTYSSDPSLPASDLQTPSERPSISSTPSSRSRCKRILGLVGSRTISSAARSGVRIFDNMIFVVTKIPNTKDREQVAQDIESNGGNLLSSGFGELFHIPSVDIGSPSKRSPQKDTGSFRLQQAAEHRGFTCLIADKHCRNEKFIQALALGIPCLATRWVRDCVSRRTVLPWEPYLLPSGESAFLGGAVRSRLLQPFQAETARLAAIIEDRPKLLQEKSVLLMMSKDEEENMKTRLLITHALGARRVSRALNLKAAARAVKEAQANEEPWDWVYSHANDQEVEEHLFGGGHAGRKRKRGRASDGSETAIIDGRTKVIGNEFVVQSLILGQLLDID
ncbi:hypothetical protein MMC12_006525 [Toensbergia leucococca]|nr:hypothetical protein [Toensbergia leucococca]